MKNGKQTLKLRKHNPQQQTQRQPVKAAGKPFFPRWAILALCLIVAGGGTWALVEFVIVSRLPPELVGKWEVSDGPQRGATFEFSRRGTLEAHLHNLRTDNMEVMVAKVAVDNKRLLITTQNPQTGRDETQSCQIVELTPYNLIVEFEKGEVYRMSRMP